jgi:hypothetical protein
MVKALGGCRRGLGDVECREAGEDIGPWDARYMLEVE